MSPVQVLESLLMVLLLAILLERAFSVLFESYYYVTRLARWRIKELIAFGASLFVCYYWHLDLISVITVTEGPTIPGIVITAAVMTGLTKGSTKLFRDVLAIGSRPYHEMQEDSEAERPQVMNRQKAQRERSTAPKDRKGESEAQSWLARSVVEAVIKVIVAVVSAALLLWLGLKK